MSGGVTPRRLVWLVAGFLVWASGLVTLYSLQGLGCGLGWQPNATRVVLLVVLAAHLAVLAYFAVRLARARSLGRPAPAGVLLTIAAWSTYAAAAATLLGLLPPILLSVCIP